MEIVSTKCCGINEIDKLGEHNTPEGAMLSFCESQLETNNKFVNPSGVKEAAGTKNAICTHYFFTGAVYPKDLTASGRVRKDHYGVAFAKFITDNDMGTVIETPCAVNEAWHPDHSVMAWMWTPNFNAVRAWYVDRRGERMLKRLEQSVVEIRSKVSYAEANLKQVSAGHYLYDHYKKTLANYRKDLKEAEVALEKVQKKTKKAA